MQRFTLSSANRLQVLAALRPPRLEGGETYRQQVRPILEAVRREGDRALLRFTRTFDGVALDNVRVSGTEIRRALAEMPRDLLGHLEAARRNLTRFLREDVRPPEPIETQPDVFCWRELRPLRRVGLYVPGGTAPLVSTALMLTVPARLAGVRELALCSPPQANGRIADPILAVCALLEVDEVYAVGGAQAIAALAYGTESIQRVDKIAGPGNAYVTAAKAEVASDPEGAAIDMLAGPSELLVLADATANPAFVAADLLSQAEHDPEARVVLVTTDPSLVDRVHDCLGDQIASLPRRQVAQAALARSSAIVVTTLAEAIGLIDDYAPEHLSIQTAVPKAVLDRVSHAGSVFLGPFAPETAGDYCSGTNHVLPTGGAARACSGLSVRTFVRTMTVQELTQDGLRGLEATAAALARVEGLEAHARAAEIRLKDR